jgi:hypothetical protein
VEQKYLKAGVVKFNKGVSKRLDVRDVIVELPDDVMGQLKVNHGLVIGHEHSSAKHLCLRRGLVSKLGVEGETRVEEGVVERLKANTGEFNLSILENSAFNNLRVQSSVVQNSTFTNYHILHSVLVKGGRAFFVKEGEPAFDGSLKYAGFELFNNRHEFPSFDGTTTIIVFPNTVIHRGFSQILNKAVVCGLKLSNEEGPKPSHVHIEHANILEWVSSSFHYLYFLQKIPQLRLKHPIFDTTHLLVGEGNELIIDGGLLFNRVFFMRGATNTTIDGANLAFVILHTAGQITISNSILYNVGVFNWSQTDSVKLCNCVVIDSVLQGKIEHEDTEFINTPEP